MKTLVLSDIGFGDTMWTEPVVQALLDAGHRVNLFVKHPCVFENHPSSDLFINNYYSLFPIEGELINLSMHTDPKKHVLQAFQNQAGINNMVLRYPNLYFSEEEKDRKIRCDYVLLHLDSYVSSHNLPRNVYGVEWSKVISFLLESGFTPLQISGKKEMKVKVAPIVETKTFRDVMSLMLHAKLFIGLDSGPSHIAASLGIPSLIFFGNVNPMYRHLNQKRKVFLQSPCPMAHCYHENKGMKSCPRVPINQIPPCSIQSTERVIEAIKNLL